MRSWTNAAEAAQQRAIAGLWSRGAPVDPEQSYVRVLNGFAASVDPMLLPTLERDPAVAGVYPVRAAYPAAAPPAVLDTEAFGPQSGRRVDVGIPGADGSGVTVALLDTGIDTRHPFLQGRLLPGIDVLDADGNPSAEPNPTEPGRPERHATGLAGLVVGIRGPAGLRGVAPGASLLPIRVAGWQPDADGGVSVYGRTDQVLAGLEAAVDPNGDGDAHDGVRVALVGVVEPFASFPDGPLARAGRGALALGTLVVAPAGNDGPAGPGYGSVAAPAGTSGALGVAASDSRGRSPTVHILLRAGLRVVASGETALGGAVGPDDVVSAPVVALRRRQVVEVTAGNVLDRLFDRAGYSRVAGSAVLLASGPTTPEVVRELAAAGARAVLVDGPIPAGSLGVDEPVEVPIVGISAAAAGEVRQALADGIPVELGVGAAAFGANPELGAVAPFSSTGLALDGGPRDRGHRPGSGPRHVGSRPQRGRRRTLRHAERLERRGRGGRGLCRAARSGTAGPRRGRVTQRARRERAAWSRRRRARHRRSRGRLGRRARRGPARRGAGCSDRRATHDWRTGDAQERLQASARRPVASGSRGGRGHGTRSPSAGRAASRRDEEDRADRDCEGAAGGARRARGRGQGARGAGNAAAHPVDGRGPQ